VAQKRQEFRAARPLIDPSRLVFLDETATTTNVTRGRCPVGQRQVDPVPFGRREVTTFVSALRHDRLTAAMTAGGATNGESFVADVEPVLLPELRAGDVVVMDDVPAHKRSAVREVIESAGGAVVDLPAYGPDLEPIENAYGKLEALLRQAKRRTVGGLRGFLFAALDAFSPQECANHFAHCGYSATPTSKAL